MSGAPINHVAEVSAYWRKGVLHAEAHLANAGVGGEAIAANAAREAMIEVCPTGVTAYDLTLSTPTRKSRDGSMSFYFTAEVKEPPGTARASVEGTITHNDGTTSRFLLTSDGYNQWGADTRTLGDSVDLAQGMMGAFAEYVEEAGQ